MFIIELRFNAIFKNRERFKITFKDRKRFKTMFKNRERPKATLKDREMININENFHKELFKKRSFNYFEKIRLYFAYLMKTYN